ncbi:MAG: M48 family metallopeptidase [Verrucomicrobiota bacterium]|nr:M48 family metallopeptidase [Limisphaera sp.]MDW8380722.1 M48 family metallopeptidase [Verrucomicrobiota bacterium]
MDFFEAQDQARRRSRVLLCYFASAVLGIALAVYCVCLWWLGESVRTGKTATGTMGWWRPRLLIACVGGTLVVIGAGSLYRILTLRSGGRAVAEALGGRLVRPDTRDLSERRLLNVVEEMAVASGMPVPPVYVMEEESGINAFAAGLGPQDAVIGVTRGCLQWLNRDELQGVIGHEFSHILNGDMRLNLRLTGWIFGIFCLSEVGRILLRTRGRNNPLPMLGLVLMLLGSIGVFFGRLIQAAVSRQREFLADAAAVQFTRNPQGLANALRKIGGLVYRSQIRHPRALEAAHMFFSSAFRGSRPAWFATHPPLEERIRRLDPSWDGQYPRLTRDNAMVVQTDVPSGQPELLRLGPSPRMPGHALIQHVGKPGPTQVRFAGTLRSMLPPEIMSAIREEAGAQAVVLGLVLSSESDLRHQQLMGLQTRLPASVYNRLVALHPVVAPLEHGARLPLVQLALPTLRLLDREAFLQFRHSLRWLMHTDRQIDLFEYALQRMIERHLSSQYERDRPKPIQYYSVRALEGEVRLVLSALSWLGQRDPETAKRSYQAGWASIMPDRPEAPILPAAECGLEKIDAALERLAQACHAIKRKFLTACVEVVATDGWLNEPEAELLRAVADALECPVPPLLAETTVQA